MNLSKGNRKAGLYLGKDGWRHVVKNVCAAQHNPLEKICMEDWAKILATVWKSGKDLQETFDFCHCQPESH